MVALRNFFIGFAVSFLGSLPLGYLNLVGLDIYTNSGLEPLIHFLLGIISVEIFVIYYTLLFSSQLVANEKLMKWIDIFGVFFLLLVSYMFYTSPLAENSNSSISEKYFGYPMFVVGVILNCLNFLQIPFWAAWNLYLLNANYVVLGRNLKYFYVLGTSIGIFGGMLTVVFFLHSISQQVGFIKQYLIPIFIPLFFMLLAFLQANKVYKKYVLNIA